MSLTGGNTASCGAATWAGCVMAGPS
jgi:hypothetical protein